MLQTGRKATHGSTVERCPCSLRVCLCTYTYCNRFVVGGSAPCSTPRQGPAPAPITGALPQTPPFAMVAGGATAHGSHPSAANYVPLHSCQGLPAARGGSVLSLDIRSRSCCSGYASVTNFCSCILRMYLFRDERRS